MKFDPTQFISRLDSFSQTVWVGEVRTYTTTASRYRQFFVYRGDGTQWRHQIFNEVSTLSDEVDALYRRFKALWGVVGDLSRAWHRMERGAS